MKIFTSETQKLGELGEDIACKFLKKQGFSIVERNYTKKWGEIDIVAKREGKLHFIEVKSVSCEKGWVSVIHETSGMGDSYRPEDNMHGFKAKRLARTIETYLLEKNLSEDISWQFDLATVYIEEGTKEGTVDMREDVIL
jgi:putative endonuclease